MGPWIVPFTDAAQLDDAASVTRVNGEVRQDDHLANMMFPVREEIAYISTFMTLAAGRHHRDRHAHGCGRAL